MPRLYHYPRRTYALLKDPRRLRDAISATCLSDRAFADLAGVNRTMIGHLLAGRRDSCTPTFAAAVAAAAGVPVDRLFTVTSAHRPRRNVTRHKTHRSIL